MRSLIILEVEHGEDTDAVNRLLHEVNWSKSGIVLNNYTVRVDLPACFVLDSSPTT